MDTFKIGDKIQIKEWDEMTKEFPIDDDGDILTPEPEQICYTPDMKHLCGKIATIIDITGNIIKLKCDDNTPAEWYFTPSMLKPYINTIRVKYFTDKIDKLAFIDGDKSDWIDLRAAENIILKRGEFALIPLGIAMQLPKGYEAHVVPRSSTFKNFGIIQANNMGIIDEKYCGDNDQWLFPALAVRDTEIHVNDRICQFRIVKKQPRYQFTEVTTLGNKDRGGFGTTGKN